MKFRDLLKLSFGNLRRTKLRSFLTTSGVIIGIGALVSMVSFGTGLQKNFSDALAKVEAFTAIRVLPQKIDIGEMMSGMEPSGSAKPLTDSVLTVIAELPGVRLAYPEVNIPARLKIGEKEQSTTVRAVPMVLGEYEPLKGMRWGRFFTSDTSSEIAVSRFLLRRMGVTEPDSVVGDDIQLVTAKLDLSNISGMMNLMGWASGESVFAQEETTLRLVGVWEPQEFGRDETGMAVIPMGLSRKIERLGFGSIFDLLKGFSFGGGYPALYIRAERVEYVEPLVDTIEAMGYGTFTILSQLSELEKGFLIFDAALGAVGTIALFVATLGIINTMVMSVLERYREIGIMKAIGATNWEVKFLFVLESSAIGLLGGILGICLGWLVTRVANAIANYFIAQQGGAFVDLFYIPWWLILGGILFAIMVSLLAGLYPASRAAKVDPVRALRYE